MKRQRCAIGNDNVLLRAACAARHQNRMAASVCIAVSVKTARIAARKNSAARGSSGARNQAACGGDELSLPPRRHHVSGRNMWRHQGGMLERNENGENSVAAAACISLLPPFCGKRYRRARAGVTGGEKSVRDSIISAAGGIENAPCGERMVTGLASAATYQRRWTARRKPRHRVGMVCWRVLSRMAATTSACCARGECALHAARRLLHNAAYRCARLFSNVTPSSAAA